MEAFIWGWGIRFARGTGRERERQGRWKGERKTREVEVASGPGETSSVRELAWPSAS